MELWASPYKLRSRSPLSAKASGLERSGALLRVREGTEFGYADLHPWPELGDLPLETQLSDLAAGRTTALSARSLAFARTDREFRARGQSAYTGVIIPRSHFLITDLTSVDERGIRGIFDQGFRTLKLKLGRDLQREIQLLSQLPVLPFTLRFDFNGTLSVAEYLRFVDRLPEEIRPRTEFIEDPVPWSHAAWRECAKAGVPLALDRVSQDDVAQIEKSPLEIPFAWCILKPAVQEPENLRSFAHLTKAQLCVTSYMDHPLGQCGAALIAAQTPEAKVCGLLTNFCLVEDEWTERLEVKDTRLVPPSGAGFGFTDLLEKENWKRLR